MEEGPAGDAEGCPLQGPWGCVFTDILLSHAECFSRYLPLPEQECTGPLVLRFAIDLSRDLLLSIKSFKDITGGEKN